MRIVITGAAGNITTQLIEELQSSHELRLVDIRPVYDRSSIIAELKKLRRLRTAGMMWDGGMLSKEPIWCSSCRKHSAERIMAGGPWR